MTILRVYSVTVDDRTATFDDIDTGLAYLRGELGTNGATRAFIESRMMTRKQYLATVEREEGAVHGR